ncbi:hypothetical protein GCM10007301_13600 [Azorhizobium oxalatiphilum]|uniref:Uncharacterized protein n=1 Tax=Azorhizobium oxalatiphilum TaxID=980631 RepID=A0A917BUV0_9HYPH|nr:hypothetical protein [Azorhizobium oxalatiphilum]GGF55262.1 hypothetical protein GCM10007301_13600 [Azorhizobium oxalatiphilum]
MSHTHTLDVAALGSASFHPRRTATRRLASRLSVPLAIGAALVLMEAARLVCVAGTMPSDARADEVCRDHGATYIGLSPDPQRWAVTCARPSGSLFTVVMPTLG